MTKARYVLIADDDVDLIKALEYTLKGMGWKYRSCLTAAEFISALKDKRPDLCLVDLNLGEVGVGFKLIRAVRKTVGFEQLPIIAISGETDSKKIAHAIESGADDYIAKPLRRASLIAKLNQLVALKIEGGVDHELRIVPTGERACTIDVTIKITTISEKGITVLTDSLISKGTVLDLSCPELADLFPDGVVRLTVGSNWKNLESPGYGMELEFNTTDEALFEKVRFYVTYKNSKS